jgi:hypothetical protein
MVIRLDVMEHEPQAPQGAGPTGIRDREKRDHCVASVRAGLFRPHDENAPDGALWTLLRAACRDEVRDSNLLLRRRG